MTTQGHGVNNFTSKKLSVDGILGLFFKLLVWLLVSEPILAICSSVFSRIWFFGQAMKNVWGAESDPEPPLRFLSSSMKWEIRLKEVYMGATM